MTRKLSHARLPADIVLLTALAHLLAAGCATPGLSGETRTGIRHAALATAEMRGGIQARKIQPEFELYRSYVANRLNASVGTNSFRDKTGNCRLREVDDLLRNPIESIAYAEALTWRMHEEARGGTQGLMLLLATAAEKLDAPTPALAPLVFNPGNVATQLVAILQQARRQLDAAYAPIAPEEKAWLAREIYAITTKTIAHGHSFDDPVAGRRVTDLLEKMDRRSLAQVAMSLALLTDPSLARALRASDLKAFPHDAKRSAQFGGTIHSLETSVGTIIIATAGNQTYALDKHPGICMIIDLDPGDDTYLEGAVSTATPLLAIVDCGGSNRFEGKSPGIQGASILGASLLVTQGCTSNRFDAVDVAQGSTLGGIALLVNDAKFSAFNARARVQGQATGGIGLLLNRAGDDAYHGAIYAQGVGGALGFGTLIDLQGNDTYFAGGMYNDGYDDSPGYGGWSQGMGIGPRGVANGGFGVLLDGAGDDLYEYDCFSHGGGYWFAAGFARDFGGNDQRIGATRTMWDRTERIETRFVRWGVGFGCHYASGYVIDDAGDDLYTANSADTAFCWDLGTGAILDFGGNDTFSGGGAGRTSNAGLALVMNIGGADTFTGAAFGHANPKVEYHPIEQAGGNFAFFLKYGGTNSFTNPKVQAETGEIRGWAGGFFISRPDIPAHIPPMPEKDGNR
jgi:hypothetical protein